MQALKGTYDEVKQKAIKVVSENVPQNYKYIVEQEERKIRDTS